jgi:hypothetical protein
LRYRLDEPGLYEVRYSLVYLQMENGQKVTKELRSVWTEITVLPSSPEQQAAWIERIERETPVDAGDLLCGFTPSTRRSFSPASFPRNRCRGGRV